jgi:hypothetical protein
VREFRETQTKHIMQIANYLLSVLLDAGVFLELDEAVDKAGVTHLAGVRTEGALRDEADVAHSDVVVLRGVTVETDSDVVVDLREVVVADQEAIPDNALGAANGFLSITKQFKSSNIPAIPPRFAFLPKVAAVHGAISVDADARGIRRGRDRPRGGRGFRNSVA